MNSSCQINGVRTVVRSSAQEASKVVAEQFAGQIRHQNESVLGLATGGTPIETYRQLIQMNRRGEADFRSVITFNLDEYIGLAGDHPQSYRAFMNANLFDQIDIRMDRTFVPDGCVKDVPGHCADYEAKIKAAGGIDLQLLGLGHNGHIAFNEPGSPASSRTRQVDLTAETIEKNARFFDSIEQVPRHAITMGIATILESREIILLALGEGKSDAVAQMLKGPITESFPASLLRNHQKVTVVLDESAASKVIDGTGR
jgi:glucosamine-6-phosphate deaminase